MLKKVSIVVLITVVVFLTYLLGKASKSNDPNLVEVGPVIVSDSVLTIAFGSCNRQDQSQAFWETIAANEPAAWLWLGDNIYSDTDDRERMAADYAELEAAPEYQAFTEQVPTIYGTWDDHDYGSNDAGREWPFKEEAKTLMLDFLKVPASAEVRQREGVYQSYLIDNVRVILLDTRYFRDAVAPPVEQGHRYGPNEEGDILGESQWAWLRDELQSSEADAHIIVSSIQVLPTDHGYEKWALFPRSRERLMNLLAELRPALPLLISGDRHLAEVMVDSVDGYPVYEVTSSGLTHSYESAEEANDKRISDLITEKNFGLLHFIPTQDGFQLLAEVRSVADNELLASLSLPGGSTNNATLAGLVHPNDTMQRQLKPCPDSPNCVSTQSLQEKKKREPIPFTGSAAEVKAKLKKVIGDMSRTEL
ncbi:MAG: alkaline phosphatase D family protein, partial [Lewinella sp.]